MKVVQLDITNFRTIKTAKLNFADHNLMVGANNVGKSTICEALDLVLGPDRLSKYPPIEEFDFHNAFYLDSTGKPVEIRIEIVLTDLADEVQSLANRHLEFWHKIENRVLSEGQIEQVDSESISSCLRLEFRGRYDEEEDEFLAKTYFSHSPDEDEGDLSEVPKSIKRKFGFLYLRTLRTGSRALSLERGSLLDIILRLGELRPKLWEDVRTTLTNLDLETATEALRPILNQIENRVAEYIPIDSGGSATKIFVSQLTREHLRKTLAFFLTINSEQTPVPFQESGTGTLNALVLALLSFIAELKKDNVIFAMEEPEIALPPHTQRRIIKYLLENATQSFITSHSPYVIERFSPNQVLLLKRGEGSAITATNLGAESSLKPKNYRRHIRRAIAEALLGKAVIVCEGLTELQILEQAAEIMEDSSDGHYPLDLSGVTIFDAGGDGSLAEYGSFFKTCGLQTYAFYDKKTRRPDEIKALAENFKINNETGFDGSEKLLAAEVPLDNQWNFLVSLKQQHGLTNIPDARPADENLKELTAQICRSKKGEGWAAALIGSCEYDSIPSSIKTFLTRIYSEFPAPRALHVVAPTAQVDPSEAL